MEYILDVLGDLIVELGNLLYENRWLLLALIVIILGSYHLRDDNYKNLRLSLAENPLKALKNTFELVGNILQDDDKDQTFSLPDNISQILKDTNDRANNFADSINNGVGTHLKSVIGIFGANQQIVVWRLIGAILCAILFSIFVYADLILIYTSVREAGYNVPPAPRLQYYVFALLISSVVTNFTLALLIIDCIGITHFIPWEGEVLSRQVSIRRGARRIAISALLLNFVLVIIIGLARMQAAVGPNFLEEWIERGIEFLFGLSQSLVIIPMFIATILLFWGLISPLVLYALLLGLLIILIYIIKSVLAVFSLLISIIRPGTVLVTQIFKIFLAFTFTALGLSLGLLLSIFELVTRIIEFAARAVIEVFAIILAVPRSILESIRKSVRRGL